MQLVQPGIRRGISHQEAPEFELDPKLQRLVESFPFRAGVKIPVMGGTGHWPVSSGDPPDETGSREKSKFDGQMLGGVSLIPVGELPTGTGMSPDPPIFHAASSDGF